MSLPASNFHLRPAASDVIDELYAAAVEPHRLSQALGLFSRMMNAEFACLVVKDFESVDMRTRVFEYSSGYTSVVAHDAWILESVAPHIRPGQVGVIGGKTRSNGPLTAGGPLSARRVQPVWNFVGLVVKGGPWISFALVAMRRMASFSDLHHGDLYELQTDVRRALSLRQLAGRSGLGLNIRLDDHSHIGTLAVRNMIVERCNPAAASLLNDQTLISNSSGMIEFKDKPAQSALEGMSRPPSQDHKICRSRTRALVIKHPGGGTWIVQMARLDGFQEAEMSARPSAPAIAVVLTPLSAASRTREAMLSSFANLTPTERSILASFVDGHGVAAIATGMNRSVETVRWHIRNLFEKLGVNTQAELARLGALLLPI